MKLRDWVIKNNINKKEVSKSLGLNERYLEKILLGDWLPSSHVVAKIARLTNGEVSKPEDYRRVKRIYLCFLDGEIVSIWEDPSTAVNNLPINGQLIMARINTLDPEFEIK